MRLHNSSHKIRHKIQHNQRLSEVSAACCVKPIIARVTDFAQAKSSSANPHQRPDLRRPQTPRRWLLVNLLLHPLQPVALPLPFRYNPLCDSNSDTLYRRFAP